MFIRQTSLNIVMYYNFVSNGSSPGPTKNSTAGLTSLKIVAYIARHIFGDEMERW